MSVENPPNVVFNDLSAALDALERGIEFLEQSLTDIQRLRWAIVATHQAAQCFMVRVLKGSDGTGILTEKGSKQLQKGIQEYKSKLWKYSTEGEGSAFPTPPVRALASFLELYERVKDPSPGRMGRYTTSKAFQPKPRDDKNICVLNELRNNFIHFAPGAWILDPGLAVSCLSTAFRLMGFLGFQSSNFLWYPAELEGKARTLMKRGKVALGRLMSMYAVDSP